MNSAESIVTVDPSIDAPEIHLLVTGRPWTASWHADDADLETPADWDGWSAELEIVDRAGLTVTRLGDSDDALVALTDQGNVTAYLAPALTALVPLGRASFALRFTDPDGTSEVAFTGYIHCVTNEGAIA